MSEDYSVQKHPVAIWNTARGVWEKAGTENLFCAHSELFSETWPTEGTMQNGRVYEPQMQAHHTIASEFSSLPIQVFGTVTTATSGRSPEFRKGANPNPVEFAEEIASKIELLRSPTASEGEGGALGEKVTRLPTPTVSDTFTGNLKSTQQKPGSMHSVTLPQAVEMLPTPTTQDGKNNAGPSQFDRNTKPLNVEAHLLGTPRTSSANGSSSKQVAAGAPKKRIEDQVHLDWGRFETAIRRWEITLGRMAPLPTKPDGKDGAHRLSSRFTEWMMGLPEGWITDVGLSRNDELKACGNGVVPQQAELALRHLLKDVM